MAIQPSINGTINPAEQTREELMNRQAFRAQLPSTGMGRNVLFNPGFSKTGKALLNGPPQQGAEQKPLVAGEADLAVFEALEGGQPSQPASPFDELGQLNPAEELKVEAWRRKTGLQREAFNAQVEAKMAEAKAIRQREQALLTSLTQAERVAAGDGREISKVFKELGMDDSLMAPGNRLSAAKLQAKARDAAATIRTQLEDLRKQRKGIAEFSLKAKLDEEAMSKTDEELLAKEIKTERWMEERRALEQTNPPATPKEMLDDYQQELGRYYGLLAAPQATYEEMLKDANRPANAANREQILQKATEFKAQHIDPIQQRIDFYRQKVDETLGAPQQAGAGAGGQGGPAPTDWPSLVEALRAQAPQGASEEDIIAEAKRQAPAYGIQPPNEEEQAEGGEQQGKSGPGVVSRFASSVRDRVLGGLQSAAETMGESGQFGPGPGSPASPRQ